MGSASAELDRFEIAFPNQNIAKAVRVPPGVPGSVVVEGLGLAPPRALILVIGSAAKFHEEDSRRLAQLLGRGIARLAFDQGAAIMDGGTQAGVMALMGESVAERGYPITLIGVSPAGKVYYPPDTAEMPPDCAPLEPNHSHFVLVESDQWGGETETMFALASSLSTQPVSLVSERIPQNLPSRAVQSMPKIPVVVVLVGGNVEGVSRKEMLLGVRNRWPVILLEGSGGLANCVSEILRDPQPVIDDPEIAEIAEEGNLHIFPIDGQVEAFRQLLLNQLTDNQSLLLAWRRLATYDAQAKRFQREFFNRQQWILILGVVTTLLVILNGVSQLNNWFIPGVVFADAKAAALVDNTLHMIILALPIITSALLALTVRYNPGNKWVLLRSSVEAMKRAIFLYRTRPVDYRTQEHERIDGSNLLAEKIGWAREKATREIELANRIETISRQLMQTDVNQASLRPYHGQIPPEGAAHT